jgi:hypothetical protein
MPELDELLRLALPELSRQGNAVVTAIVGMHAEEWTVDELAKSLGLSNRYAVERLLRREGLPSCAKLLGWVRILEWVLACEDDAASLCHLALSDGGDPAARYRTVKRITGLSWSQVRRGGSVGMTSELASQCDGTKGRCFAGGAGEKWRRLCPAGKWIRRGDCLLHGSETLVGFSGANLHWTGLDGRTGRGLLVAT